MIFATAAQAAAAVNPDLIGIAITSLVASLGCAGAAVAVTYYFLDFLRREGDKADRIFSEFRDYHAESQKKFQDQLERLADRQGSMLAEHRQALAEQRQSFRAELQATTSRHVSLTRDAMLTMRAVEKTIAETIGRQPDVGPLDQWGHSR